MVFILCPYFIGKRNIKLLGPSLCVHSFIFIFVPLRHICPSLLRFIELCNKGPSTFSHSHVQLSPVGWSELRAAMGGILLQDREPCASGRLLWPLFLPHPIRLFETPSCLRDWAWLKLLRTLLENGYLRRLGKKESQLGKDKGKQYRKWGKWRGQRLVLITAKLEHLALYHLKYLLPPALYRMSAGNCHLFHNPELKGAHERTVSIEKAPTWSPLCSPLILAWIHAHWHSLNGRSVYKLTHCRQALLLLCGNLPFPFPTVSLVNSYKLSQTAGCVLKSLFISVNGQLRVYGESWQFLLRKDNWGISSVAERVWPLDTADIASLVFLHSVDWGYPGC